MADGRAAKRTLIAELEEADTFIEFPGVAEYWSLAEIQAYYDSCGEVAPDSPPTCRLPGAPPVSALDLGAELSGTSDDEPSSSGSTPNSSGKGTLLGDAEPKNKKQQQKKKKTGTVVERLDHNGEPAPAKAKPRPKKGQPSPKKQGKKSKKPEPAPEQQQAEETLTPRSAEIANETARLVERALDGASAVVARHRFADDGHGSHNRQVLDDTIDKCFQRMDGSVGRLLVAPHMEHLANSLFKAIDAIRDIETTPAERVDEAKLVTAVLRLAAILTKAFDTIRSERTTAWQMLRAARKGEKAELLRLLAGGTDINTSDSAGHTALMEACQYRHEDCVQVLLSHGSDVNLVTALGWSALKFAALDGDMNLPCLKLLLAAKPDLETRSEGGLYGNTVLHNAAESGYPGVVQALLDAGCSKSWKNADMRTPLDLAIARKHHEAARCFSLDAGDHCQVVVETARCGSAVVSGWLRYTGATDETVELFEKAGVTGKDLLWALQVRDIGVSDPKQVALIENALMLLPARRENSLWRRGRRGIWFILVVFSVVMMLLCGYWYSFFFGYTIAQTWNDAVKVGFG